jgi:hypothetical protein
MRAGVGKIFATRRWVIPVLGVCLSAGVAAAATPRTFATPSELLRAMITEEQDSAAKHERYEYLSRERSERTGGRVWTERVVETGQGKIRRLLEVDGVPVSAQKTAQERGRLAAILANPTEFEKSEAARMGDEAKSRKMLDDLDRGFILEHVELVDGVWRVNYRPNPDFSPSGIEERVLHGMSGWLSIDAKDLRLVHIEGKLPVDVSIGYGLLATIHAGSHFASDREFIDGHWRTTHVVTDIRGKAVLFKSVAKDSDLTRSGFHYLDPNITLAQAVALVEQ